MNGKALRFIWLLLSFMIIVSFFVFFGNPLERMKSKERVTEYLEEAYPELQFTIDDVSYYPFEGTYIIHAVSKDRMVEKTIDVRNGNLLTEN